MTDPAPAQEILRILRNRSASASLAVQPLRGSALADLTGLTMREVQKIIKRMVEGDGQPILSTSTDPPGYYLARTPEEVRECAKGLRRRGISCLVRASRLQGLAAQMEAGEQGELFG